MYVGLDVHKMFVYATVLDEQGNKVKEERFLNTLEELDEFIQQLPEDTKAVLEASSTWDPIYDYLEGAGVDVKLAHPLKTRAIAEARIKTDSIDPATLAHLLRTDLIPESYVPPKEIRDLRTIVRHRASLVRLRTEVKNKIHALLAKEGIRHNFTDLFGKKGMKFLMEIDLREANKLALDNYLSVLEVLNSRVKETSARLESLANGIKEVELLRTIPGIGTYSALLIVSEIGNINRFKNPQKLTSYAGLVPSVHQSGSTKRFGRITKQGSGWLRWILVQATHKTVIAPSKLQDFYRKLALKKGKKIAVTATARKMLVTIYWMLIRNQSFHAYDRAQVTSSAV